MGSEMCIRDRFTFKAMPALAQVAPVFGLALGFYDDDHILDVVVAQNFFGPQVETGRADGGVGLLLAGQGDGSFLPVAARESGVVIPGDATSLVSANLDADPQPELIVATNDGPVTRLDTTDSVQLIAVQLQGKGANAEAVGAQVLAVYTDGTQHLTEVTSGGGYLSQSSRTTYLHVSDDRKPVSYTHLTLPTIYSV